MSSGGRGPDERGDGRARRGPVRRDVHRDAHRDLQENPDRDVARAHAGARRVATPYAPRRPEAVGSEGRLAAPQRPPGHGPGAALRRFTRRHGWRAYALPVLVIVTVAALLTSTSSASGSDKAHVATSRHHRPTPSVAPSHITLKDDSPGGKVDDRVLKGYSLPAGSPYTTRGKGTFRILKGSTPVMGRSRDGKVWRYSIDVENGMQHVDLASFEKTVDTVLADKRSWSGHGYALKRVDSGRIDFHISLTTSMTVRKWCGYSIHVETSCYAPAGSRPVANVNRVVFNDARWVRGSTAYLGDLPLYREYMINHEDGHALGHEHAHACLDDGLAPAMMQQTFGLRSALTHKLCQANPWPFPPGAKDAPGKEAPDTPQNDEYDMGD